MFAPISLEISPPYTSAIERTFVAGAVGFYDWAIAPEMITPLAAIVIRRFLSIFDVLHIMQIFG